MGAVNPGFGVFASDPDNNTDASGATADEGAPTQQEEDARTRSETPWSEGDSVEDAGLPDHEDDTKREGNTETGTLNP